MAVGPRCCQHDERRLSRLRGGARFGAGSEFGDHLAEVVRTAAVADDYVPARGEGDPGDCLSGDMARIARFLGHSGNYTAARVLQQQITDTREQVLGGEHPRTVAARANLARWTGQAGDPAAARQYAALLPVRERVLGAEHPDTLAARAKLAYWTGEAGDPAAARDQVAALLPVRQRVLGAEHPRTLADRAKLAYWTGQAGDPAAARDQVAALLPVRERVLGAQHPHTLSARANLARWTGQATAQATNEDHPGT
jgi:hypothetical protein